MMRLRSKIAIAVACCVGGYLTLAGLAGYYQWFMTGAYDKEAAKEKIERMFTYQGKFDWERFVRYAQAVFRQYDKRRYRNYFRLIEVLVFLRDAEVEGDISLLLPFIKAHTNDRTHLRTGGTWGLWPFIAIWDGFTPIVGNLCRDILERYRQD